MPAFIGGLITLASHGGGQAAEEPAGLSSLRQSDSLRLEALRQRAAPKLGDVDAPATPQAAATDTQDQTCLQASGVRAEGASLIPADELLSWIQAVPIKAGCVTLGDVNALLYKLSTWYLQNGYVTSQPVSFSVDAQGTLVIQVLQGRIGQIVSTDPRISTKGLISQPDDVLNLRVIEQAISQINRLDSRAIAVDIEPGEQPGTSIVKLRPQSTLPARDWSIQTSVDNHDNGQLKGTLAVSMDNLLGHNENVYLAHTRELNQHDTVSHSYSALLAIPDGYSTYSTSLYRSNSEAPITPSIDAQTARISLALKWDRVLHRSRSLITAMSMELTHDESVQKIGQTALQSSSWNVNHLSTGLSLQHNAAAWSGSLGLQVDRGLGGMGIEQAPQANYSSTAVQASLKVPLSRRWSMAAQARAQYTPDYVPGFKQFWIGGSTLVPGFRPTAYAGNSGAITQLQLNWIAPNFGAEGLLGKPFGHQLSLNQTTGWIFGDAQSDTRKLASIGLQYAALWGPWTSTLTWAMPLYNSDVSVNKDDDWTVWLGYRY